MNQEEQQALRRNLAGKTDRDLLIDDIIATHELREELSRVTSFLWGNGKIGFVTKVLLWGAALSMGVLLGLGERAYALIQIIRAIP